LIISPSFVLFQNPTVIPTQEAVAMSVIRPVRLASIITAVTLTATVLFSGCSSGKLSYPLSEKQPLTDEYHGVKVVDDYRWLDNLGDPKVRAWNDAQNQLTRSILDKVPSRPRLYERLKAIIGENSSSYFSLIRRSKLFALKHQPPKNQPLIVMMVSPDEPAAEKVLVDPNQIDVQGTTAIDFFVPSRDGRLLAVCMSKNGTEDGSMYVFDAETGGQLADVVPRVQYPTGGGSVAWNKDASGFYYTRYPQGNERPREDLNFYQQVYYHKLGTPASDDTYAIGKEFPRIAEIRLSTSDDGIYILATVANGDGGEFAHYLLIPAGQWIQITQFSDDVTLALFGKDGKLYLLSHKNAPGGKILAMPLVKPALSSAREIVPESDGAIESFLPTRKFVYVNTMIGGPSQIRLFDLQGTSKGAIPSPAVASVEGLVDLGTDEVLYGQQSYLVPSAFYLYNAATGATRRSGLFTSSSVRFDDCEAVREVALSNDGTKVPINIIRKKGTVLDGKNPTILYGYGGYGVNMTPYFSPSRRVWLDHGGVYCIANLRGGGEFGEEWHKAGRLTKKQNVFDDFAACARHLVERKYTSPEKLAIEGGSNGGLLMGAALTQHPDLFRAVVSHVGIYDMLRVELFPNGAFNVTEFGSVKDPEQFHALYAYSPYHRVEGGKKYPAVLMLTGDNDGRVDPANSRKMIARLQTATGSSRPILLRTTSSAGHGIGTALSEEIAQRADVFAFLFDQLEMK
jgi:prolyl oligopeptidase